LGDVVAPAIEQRVGIVVAFGLRPFHLIKIGGIGV
jgi:hypothetical protein